ncbi:hypothetical protein [Halomonas sp. PR-M31]|nr:hypothetical protein [Halomonas sp. PR-M31]
MNKLCLVSENYIEYSDAFYSLGEVEDVHIIDRVFWWEVFD